MITKPFAPSISLWQHYVTIVALLWAAVADFSAVGLLVFFVVIVAGGAVEGVVLALRPQGGRG
ncbi:MAG: hypothetical protein LBE53_19225 [Paucimonas sp.]|jgi:hypothetical protein|nr:hypothetical protein [Paucimonas sp.]